MNEAQKSNQTNLKKFLKGSRIEMRRQSTNSIVEKERIINAARAKLAKLPINITTAAITAIHSNSLIGTDHPATTVITSQTKKAELFHNSALSQKSRLSTTKLPSPNSFPKAIVYPNKNKSKQGHFNQIAHRRASLSSLSSLNVFKTPAPAQKFIRLAPNSNIDTERSRYTKVTSESKFDMIQQSKPRYILKSQVTQKPSTSTANEQSQRALPTVQDTKAHNYVIQKPIQNKLIKVAPSITKKQSFRPYYVPEKKKLSKMNEDLFETLEDSTKAKDNGPKELEESSPTSRSRRKTTLVPNSVDAMHVEFEEPYMPPTRPKANIVMMQRLSLYRALARGLLDKIHVPQMDFNDSDHISMYKFYR